uniref:Uncharacterized protein n=1 Tax=Oryza sativa subsp. japonica TaxID=39947 RepID=Q6K7N1_ORYSJ|nr:hypothetical protein [Oryza sativa Japonica Group]
MEWEARRSGDVGAAEIIVAWQRGRGDEEERWRPGWRWRRRRPGSRLLLGWKKTKADEGGARAGINDLPNELYDVAWDIMLIDGSSGWNPTSSGQMLSIASPAAARRRSATSWSARTADATQPYKSAARRGRTRPPLTEVAAIIRALRRSQRMKPPPPPHAPVAPAGCSLRTRQPVGITAAARARRAH